MTPTQRNEIEQASSTAAQLSALCHFLATALAADPDTATASEAVEGIGAMAIRLSNRLHNLTEDGHDAWGIAYGAYLATKAAEDAASDDDADTDGLTNRRCAAEDDLIATLRRMPKRWQ